MHQIFSQIVSSLRIVIKGSIFLYAFLISKDARKLWINSQVPRHLSFNKFRNAVVPASFLLRWHRPSNKADKSRGENPRRINKGFKFNERACRVEAAEYKSNKARLWKQSESNAASFRRRARAVRPDRGNMEGGSGTICTHGPLHLISARTSERPPRRHRRREPERLMLVAHKGGIHTDVCEESCLVDRIWTLR